VLALFSVCFFECGLCGVWALLSVGFVECGLC